MAEFNTGAAASPPRWAHQLNIASLQTSLLKSLGEQIPQANRDHLTISQFSHGQSNPTYLLTFGQAGSKIHPSPPATKLVLRKKPPGMIMVSAHAVEREFKVLSALAAVRLPGTPLFPVPRPLVLCEDITVIGTPFYVVSDDTKLPSIADYSPAINRQATTGHICPDVTSSSTMHKSFLHLLRHSNGAQQKYCPNNRLLVVFVDAKFTCGNDCWILLNMHLINIHTFQQKSSFWEIAATFCQGSGYPVKQLMLRGKPSHVRLPTLHTDIIWQHHCLLEVIERFGVNTSVAIS